ncbi:MAG: hypothetical protein CVV10_01335 [Gammaproteobacteria bacterium HGW-Gammaproteobacteria-14]|nr:MAG: hypothetical protein CVV10_01335 [Gammaproteobacteria bacterium HGW-Gammaproteobacteria-14]
MSQQLEGMLADDRGAFEQACDSLLSSCRRHARIFAPDLDQQLLNRDAVSEQLVRLVRENRNARIQIMLNDPESVVQSGHRLLYVARRLSSYISIRVSPIELQDMEQCWLIADEHALLWRPDFRYLRHGIRQYGGERVGQLQRLFDNHWDKATTAPSLRQLHL